jgi:uncharacterized LabA/DUF88 family protein
MEHIDFGRKKLTHNKLRIECFVDGYNLYHAICRFGVSQKRQMNYLKWVDLWKLMECFVNPKIHSLNNVFYFSSYASFYPKSFKRHKCYVKALEFVGVTFIEGKFQGSNRSCKTCGSWYQTHEEKQTDINLALHLFYRGISDLYDIAYIVSSDSDFVAAIKMLKQIRPDIQTKMIAPIGMQNRPELREVSGRKPKNTVIREEHLQRSLFPERLTTTDGEILRPKAYYIPPIYKGLEA